MTWLRTKQMPAAEWPEFRARFESLFADFKDDPGLALQVTDGPDGTVIVSIPFFRSGLVETFSPGGWRDRAVPTDTADRVNSARRGEHVLTGTSGLAAAWN